jgi:phosphoglycolate phosphatase-like HAD superfamily hydrolase
MVQTMKRKGMVLVFACVVLTLVTAVRAEVARAQDALPSWNEGPTKEAILKFVAATTTEGSTDFVPVAERIATFDNDGTLWCEQPMYFQALFALDRIKLVAGQHPEWRDQEPFKSVLTDDRQQLADLGEKALLDIVAATHSGMTTDEFNATVREWLATARHPRFKQPYNKCIYQPMVEVLAFLRANGFKTFIVSGGGIEFMRVWADGAYGIPPEQVVGSSGKLKYEVRLGLPVIAKLPEVNFIDDGPGKPVGIQLNIGRRPILAFGNSDGDFEMLEWTTAAGSEPGRPRPRLGLIVHHTDAVREYAYDRDSKVGKLSRALDEAPKRGWVLIDMKNDWKQVFAFE